MCGQACGKVYEVGTNLSDNARKAPRKRCQRQRELGYERGVSSQSTVKPRRGPGGAPVENEFSVFRGCHD